MKVKTKVSGCFRTEEGVRDYVAIMIYVGTAQKHGINPFSAILSAVSGMNIVDTQMYIDGYQVKLVSDTSYGSLWEVSFTLKEF